MLFLSEKCRMKNMLENSCFGGEEEGPLYLTMNIEADSCLCFTYNIWQKFGYLFC